MSFSDHVPTVGGRGVIRCYKTWPLTCRNIGIFASWRHKPCWKLSVVSSFFSNQRDNKTHWNTYLDSAVSSLFIMIMDQHKHAESKELNKARSSKRSRTCLKCPNTLFLAHNCVNLLRSKTEIPNVVHSIKSWRESGQNQRVWGEFLPVPSGGWFQFNVQNKPAVLLVP